jgi:hypothetical protein
LGRLANKGAQLADVLRKQSAIFGGNFAAAARERRLRVANMPGHKWGPITDLPSDCMHLTNSELHELSPKWLKANN